MPKLTFSQFAGFLYAIMSGDHRVDEFCCKLFEKITDDSLHRELEKDSAEIWKFRFNGSRSINALAKRIYPKLQVEKFGAFINDFDDMIKQDIITKLKPYRPTIDDNSIGLECADLFLEIIRDAAKSYRKKKTTDILKPVTDLDIDVVKIESDLRFIIEELSRTRQSQLCTLRLFAIELPNKIEEKNGLLLEKVSWQVRSFYYKVVELFEQAENLYGKKFKLIASKVSLMYQKLSSEKDEQEKIFNKLVDWLQHSFPDASRVSCEIIISFFIQNCEVFDELP